MNIYIWGVGRSATKSALIQAIHASSYAGKDVWVNYEPFYWSDRTASKINYYGLKCHEKIDLITPKESKLLSRFVRNLHANSSNNEIISITKFIRGLGRIDAINREVIGDVNILVIRDLYSLLSSVLTARWDLLGQSLKYKNDWYRLENWIKINKSTYPQIFNFYNRPLNRIDKNAIWWFVMNFLAIDSIKRLNGNIYFDTSNVFNDVSKKINNKISENTNFDVSGIRGNEIHSNNYFFNSLPSHKNNIINYINAFIFYSGIHSKCLIKSDLGGFTKPKNPQNVGNKKYQLSEYGGFGKILLEKNAMYDEMLEIISDKAK